MNLLKVLPKLVVQVINREKAVYLETGKVDKFCVFSKRCYGVMTKAIRKYCEGYSSSTGLTL